ncbi:PREDICTED: tetratricopeptide repeat protein 14-like isoform X2 [Branchiostoma belcheri]|uniref:Tetratricopeptide repeat protein 14-like isoform X2 n=1 Tax=Branchiostoma belcheri TaxID=7741 RepID=A0A6P4YCA0_BRABE|nr:PREDICTED: tetratricopeptide repeat protein 14-like isoform X2 [Branchiostoma belcheri]
MEFRHDPQGAPMSPPTLAHLVDTTIMDVSADFHGNSLRSRIQEEFGLSAETGDRHKDTDRAVSSFQQRIESFIVRKADVLFQTRSASHVHRHQAQAGKDEEDYYAVLPPLEQFMGVPILPAKDRFYKMVEPGDTVVGKIVSMKDFGFFVKLLCLTGGAARDVQDMDITALCLSSDLPSHGAHQRPIDYYHTNDLIQAVVKTVSVLDDRIVISLIHNHSPQPLPQGYLGIITSDDLPVHFRRSQDLQTSQTSYDDLLQRVWGFSNPSNVSYLGGVLDIADKHPPSLMRGLHRCPFPQTDFAESLRQQQSSKWALACVGTGVQHFKSGRHVEAMQCLEKALTFDPANVEALVVRGALYANKNSLLRAMEDFAQALKLNPGHNNARKYMCETLLARGKQLQEEGEDEDAMMSYQRALVINPDLQEAKEALEQVRTKLENLKTASQVDMTSGGEELPAELSFAQRSKEKLQKLLDVEGSSKDKSGKKRKGIENGPAPVQMKTKETEANRRKGNNPHQEGSQTSVQTQMAAEGIVLVAHTGMAVQGRDMDVVLREGQDMDVVLREGQDMDIVLREGQGQDMDEVLREGQDMDVVLREGQGQDMDVVLRTGTGHGHSAEGGTGHGRSAEGGTGTGHGHSAEGGTGHGCSAEGGTGHGRSAEGGTGTGLRHSTWEGQRRHSAEDMYHRYVGELKTGQERQGMSVGVSDMGGQSGSDQQDRYTGQNRRVHVEELTRQSARDSDNLTELRKKTTRNLGPESGSSRHQGYVEVHSRHTDRHTEIQIRQKEKQSRQTSYDVESQNRHTEGHYKPVEGKERHAKAHNTYFEGQHRHTEGQSSHTEGERSYSEAQSAHVERQDRYYMDRSERSRDRHTEVQGRDVQGRDVQGRDVHVKGQSEHAGHSQHVSRQDRHRTEHYRYKEGDRPGDYQQQTADSKTARNRDRRVSEHGGHRSASPVTHKHRAGKHHNNR